MTTKNKILITISAIVVAALLGFGGYALGQKLTADAEQKKAETAQQEAVKKAIEQTKLEMNKNNTPANVTRPPHEVTPPKVSTETTCNADELSLAIANADGGGAGTLNYNIVLTNTSKRTCILGGYPGVSLVNDNGNQIGNPADRTTDKPVVKLTLTPGTKVKALVSTPDDANFPEGTCKDGATKLRVYAPNDAGYLSVATTTTAWCPGFKVSPVEAL
jgi:hypothetical protein